MKDSTIQRKVLPVVILFGLLLRLFRLGYHDLWYDEVKSILLANNYGLILNPPFFYLILRFWIKLFGQSEFSIRFPALLFSTLSIPSVYILAKKLFDSRVGILTALIIALSPMQLWYAQEARPYSTVLFFSIASAYFLIMLIKKTPGQWAAYFALSSTLGMYSGQLYPFLLITYLAIYLLFTRDKIEVKNLFLSTLFISLCLLPWASRYLQRFNYIRQGFWIPQPNLHSFAITLENFLVGYNLAQWQYYIADLLILILLFVAGKTIYDRAVARNNLYICLSLLAFPAISIYLFSKIFFSIYLDRALIILSPYFYILLAIGIKELSRKKAGLPVCCIFFILLLTGIKSFYQDYMPAPFEHRLGVYIKRPIKPLIKFIDDNSRPGDIVAFANHSTRPSFKLYAAKPRKYYEFFDPDLPDTDWNRFIQEEEYYIPKQKISLLKANRIWLIASNWSHDGRLDEQSKSVKGYLDKAMVRKLSKNIDGNWIFLYEKQ